MSATPYTDAELVQLLNHAAASGSGVKFVPIHIYRLLNIDLPKLVFELREERRVHHNAVVIAAKGIDGLTERVQDLESQIAARDAQITRLRQIVEHEEVTT